MRPGLAGDDKCTWPKSTSTFKTGFTSDMVAFPEIDMFAGRLVMDPALLVTVTVYRPD